MRSRPTILRLAVALLLIAAAIGLHRGRRAFIASFRERGPGGAPPPRFAAATATTPAPAAPPPDAAGVDRRLRVVVLDGLGLTAARALPALGDLCRAGLDLRLDVGFPTVSLPVQSVLWTGLTQQQSGLEYVIRPLSPPLRGLPARVPGSIAVAESHAFIVESMGFAATRPAPAELIGETAAKDWEATGFAAAAAAAVASPTALALVHVLRIDDVGHAEGAAAPRYAAAAAASDRLLGALRAAAPTASWVVLADHGHRPGGGHGGSDPEIRIVRACLAGPIAAAVPRPPPGRLVHLVDLSRALADHLGVAPAAAAAGRPLAVALAAPEQPGATLPRPPPHALALAIALLALGLGATLLAARRDPWRLPWWAVVAYLSVIAFEGQPSLSAPMVYSPLGRTIFLASLPGLALLAVRIGLDTAGAPYRMAVAQLALPLAGLAACLALTARRPPLTPVWTGTASMAFLVVLSGMLVVALGLLAGLAPSWFDRSRARASRP